MLFAIKSNRQYKITEDEKQRFIDAGYEIAKFEDGKLIYEKAETDEAKLINELKTKIKALEAELKVFKKEQEKTKKTKGEGK